MLIFKKEKEVRELVLEHLSVRTACPKRVACWNIT